MFSPTTPSQSSPLRLDSTSTQILPPCGKRPKCIANLALDKPSRFKLVMFDFALKLPVEVKPVLRKTQQPDDLDTESCEQVTGHLAKFLKRSLNLLGCGTSSWATGMSCTPAHVKVIMLKPDFNDEMGLPRLHRQCTKRLPLVSAACFDRWKQSSAETGDLTPAHEESLKSLRQSLNG